MKEKLWAPASLLLSALATAPSRTVAWAPTISQRFVSHCSTIQPSWATHQAQRYFSRYSARTFASDSHPQHSFRRGDKVQVEVTSFGPLGASVAVVGLTHDVNAGLLAEDEEPYGTGLVLQKEIAYFRQARNNVDVVLGEVLPAFVQNIREDGKIDIGLRPYGGKAKAMEISSQIIDRLEWDPDGTIPLGDKSSPREISSEFPGVSKTQFKNAIGALYKKGLIKPSPNSISLTRKE